MAEQRQLMVPCTVCAGDEAMVVIRYGDGTGVPDEMPCQRCFNRRQAPNERSLAELVERGGVTVLPLERMHAKTM